MGPLLDSCQGSDQFSERKGGIASGTLARKRFNDDDFICANLTEAAKSPEGADDGTGSEEPSHEDSESVTIVEGPSTLSEAFLLDDEVTYNGKIKGLLGAKCVSCHKPGGTPPDVSTYKAAKASGEDSLRTIEDGSMPTSKPLPEPDQAAFKAWVTAGYPEGASSPSNSKNSSGDATKSPTGTQAKNTGDSDMCQAPVGASSDGDDDDANKPAPKPASPKPGTPPSGTEPPKPTFVGGVKALLDSKCNGCHKPGGTPPDLTTFEKAKAEGPSSLATIEDGSMPPAKPLEDDQKSLFKKWSEAGYPEK